MKPTPEQLEPIMVPSFKEARPVVMKDCAEVTVRRWSHNGATSHKEVLSEGELVLGVALSATDIRLVCGRKVVFEGTMRPGMTYICRPTRPFHVEFTGAADILHLQLVGQNICRHMGASIPGGDCSWDITPAVRPRDGLVEALAKALLLVKDGGDERYRDALAQAIALRTTQIEPSATRAYPLAKPRLKQVIAYIEAHLAEPISLNDLASVAGLSRTHFAAQFRLATGCSPCEFVLLQRVEAAKRMLADPSVGLIEIAFNVGFQAQAHFSTVFKRFVGETPGRWRRNYLAAPPGEIEERWGGAQARRFTSEQNQSLSLYVEI